MIVSFLTLCIGNNQGMGDVEYAKMHDFFVPPAYLKSFDGPRQEHRGLWRVLGRPLEDGGMIVGTIIKPKLGLRPELFAEACYRFWLGGDFVKNDEPQGNQVFAPYRETMRLVADAMRRAQDETGAAKLFSANITADDPMEMIARGQGRARGIRRQRGPRRLSRGRLRCRPGGGHDLPAPFSGPVPALPPRRSRRRDLSPVQARLHRLRPGQDGAPARCFRHPHGDHGLRQDGGRCRATAPSRT